MAHSRKTGHVALLTLIISGLCFSHAEALVIRAYEPATHDRFLNFPSNPSHNSNFLHAAYDLTGVGWDATDATHYSQYTMISPIHFVGANHARCGATLRFVNRDGVIKSYSVASQTAITNDDGDASDLFYGTLSAPIPDSDNIGYHPYLELTHSVGHGKNVVIELDNNAYINKDIIILGKTDRGANGKISAILSASASNTNPTQVFRWDYSLTSGLPNDSHLQSGDSGSPVFINQGGVAAIVGINSLVDTESSTSTYYSYANFIPHYADKLDTAMATQGYHMTRAIPGSTTLTLTHTPPVSTIRAGHDFTIHLSLNNTGSNLADNVKLQNSFPSGTYVTSASGTDWFDESITNLTKARRAYLDSSTSTNYSVTLNIPDPGTAQHQVTYSADQFTSSTESFNLNVIESFVSWSANLTDQSEQGDDDLDGSNNLLEYAFGGDPAENSTQFPVEELPLNPIYSLNGNTLSITYNRRTDYQTRALSYTVMTSATLEATSWADATSMVTAPNVTPINSNFERVQQDLQLVDPTCFFRMKVLLNE